MDKHSKQAVLGIIYEYERNRGAATSVAASGQDEGSVVEVGAADLRRARATWLELAEEERVVAHEIERLTPELAWFVHSVLRGGRPWRSKTPTCWKPRRRRRKAKRKAA